MHQHHSTELAQNSTNTPTLTPESYLSRLANLNGDLIASVFDDAVLLSTFPRADQAKLFVELHRLGVDADMRGELRELINSHKKRTAKPKPDAGALKQSERIAADLAAWGYGDIWLNEMDNDVMVGDLRLDDVTEAQINTTARDNSYAELKLLSALKDTIVAIAAKKRKHPLRDYLDGLKWDGQDHVATLAGYVFDTHDEITYADGERRTVFHAFLLRWLVGSVAKIHGDVTAARDNRVLVLAGQQGIGKSHLVGYLCALPDYLVERHVDPDNKDTSLLRARTWIWEISELGATTKRADVEALKAFITATTVTERKSYGHFDTKVPAIASYVGTVNPDGAGFLTDTTGNRRFAIVELQHIDHRYTSIDVAQVWAQVMHIWRNDPQAYRLAPEEIEVQTGNNDNHMDGDVYADILARIFLFATDEEKSEFKDADREEWSATSSEILDKMRMYGGLSHGQDRVQGRELARSLKKHWQLDSKRSNGKTVYCGLKLSEKYK